VTKEKKMKRSISITIVTALTLMMVSLISSDSTANAAPPPIFRADTGLIIPGPHQKVRLTISGFGEDLLRVQFRQINYSQEVCNGGLCKHNISSQTTSDLITLMPGEAASFDIPNTAFGVRGVVVSNRRNVRATAAIIDTITGELTILETMEESEDGL
jgi:hypothetical protein